MVEIFIEDSPYPAGGIIELANQPSLLAFGTPGPQILALHHQTLDQVAGLDNLFDFGHQMTGHRRYQEIVAFDLIGEDELNVEPDKALDLLLGQTGMDVPSDINQLGIIKIIEADGSLALPVKKSGGSSFLSRERKKQSRENQRKMPIPSFDLLQNVPRNYQEKPKL